MHKKCILDDEKLCDACGECDVCDLDQNKKCDNCMRCVQDESATFRKVDLGRVRFITKTKDTPEKADPD